MLSRNKKLLIVVLVLILAGAVLYTVLKPKPNVQLEIAPSPATVILDGTKHVKTAGYRLTPGQHSLQASMDGFATLQKTFTVTDGKVSTVFVVLQPNSAAGNAYFKAHPDEERRWESLSGQNQGAASQQITNNNPIIKLLPYVASDNSYRVDYGGVSGTKVHVYITSINQQAQQQAESWITSQGYQLNNLLLTTSIEPLLNGVPYKTTDFDIEPDFGAGPDGQPVLHLDITLILSGADSGNKDAAEAQYKQEALDYINSLGVNPANYQITYTILQG